MKDLLIAKAIQKEELRQLNNIECIASENYVSNDVLEAVGSVLTNKYAEGYPNKRYYGGCVNVDEVEDIARVRLCELFGAEHANVQPHSGSQANMAVYFTVLQPGDTVLGMDLASGGHLTHGHPLNFSGSLYNFVSYGVNKETEMIDYEEVREIIDSMKFNDMSDVFGVEKEKGKLNGIICQIYQHVFGQELYPSIEEKAAHLLYFLVKDHPFADGCKRIAATLFINFLYKNNRLYKDNKQIISNEALVAITILTAESNPEEMDIIVKLIMNLLITQ